MPPRFRSRISLRGPALFLPCEAGSLGGRAHDGRCCRRGILPGGRACGRSVLRAGASSARWNVWRWAPSGELFPGIGTGDAPGGFGRVWTGLEEQSLDDAGGSPRGRRGQSSGSGKTDAPILERIGASCLRRDRIFLFIFPLPLSVVRDQKGCLRDPVSERQVAPPPQSGIRSLPGPDQNGRSSTSAGVEA